MVNNVLGANVRLDVNRNAGLRIATTNVNIPLNVRASLSKSGETTYKNKKCTNDMRM